MLLQLTVIPAVAQCTNEDITSCLLLLPSRVYVPRPRVSYVYT